MPHTKIIIALAYLSFCGTLHAQTPVATVANIPPPDFNAYSTSLRYDSSGDLYAWDGYRVWEQSGGTGGFLQIGEVGAGNSADAGPISFSQSGQSVLLSNGAGGAGEAGNGIFWTTPAGGGAATQVSGSGIPYATDALALPAAATIPGAGSKYVVYAGDTDTGGGTTLSIYDAATGANTPIIANGPGASAAIAFNPQNNRLYVDVGYGTYAGDIYSFTLGQIDAAYSAGPLDFFTAGTLFNSAATGYQSGAGMFFDKNGYLFAGGDGITVFRPDGSICYNKPGDGAVGYDTLVYDSASNGVLKVPYSLNPYSQPASGSLYNAADFELAAAGVFWTATSGTGGSWSNGNNWSLSTVPAGGTVVFADTPGGPIAAGPITVTLDGNQAAGALTFSSTDSSGYTLSQGTGGSLTLGTSAGASIAVQSGSHTISAPLVLAGNLAVSTSAGAMLDISGDVGQSPGVSAGIVLSGGGELVLSGTNSFSGGATVTGGLLEIENAAALPDGSALTVGSAAVFDATTARGVGAQPEVAPVPEPGCGALFIAAAAVAFVLRRNRRLSLRESSATFAERKATLGHHI